MNEEIGIIQRLNAQVRDYINNPRKHYLLYQNRQAFSQLASSLDVIEDSEEAINAYEAEEFGESKSAHYLAIYGLLQALFVQQDALCNLAQALGAEITPWDYPEFERVRDIRNDSIGHPTKRKSHKGRPASFHHISRITLTNDGFELLSFFADGELEHQYVGVSELISRQRQVAARILRRLIAMLEKEEKKHKERFMTQELTPIFSGTFGYHRDKIVASAFVDGSDPELALAHLDIVESAVHEFRDKVAERDPGLAESFEEDYQLLEYSIDGLHSYFESVASSEAPPIPRRTVQIFAEWLRDKVERLRVYAEDIDKDYAD